GAGVKGNMAELVRFARAPYPLPLGALQARRSLLALDNLVAAVDAVLAAPQPLRRPLIVADPEAVAIPRVIAAPPPGRGGGPRTAAGAAALAGGGAAHDRPQRGLSTAGRLADRGSVGAGAARLVAAGQDHGRACSAGAQLMPRNENAQPKRPGICVEFVADQRVRPMESGA